MAASQPATHERVLEEQLEKNTVLIVGGGPAGLVLATTLAYFGVKSVVLERNDTTTRWPKMDLTNARSMELFRKLGLVDDLRAQGVPSHFPYTVHISTGLNEEEHITAWEHDSVDKYRQKITDNNDGSLPLEPYQRLSQSVFEAWLRKLCDKNPLIELRFGVAVKSVLETETETSVLAADSETGQIRKIVSRFIGACDGASSRIRRGLSIPLDGGPVPNFSLLIHFKSKDLTQLHRQGQFWHIFFLGEGRFMGAIIGQDEKDTWTTHLQLPLDTDPDTIDSYDAVYTVLGGGGPKYEIKIDEILVRSTYRPSIAVARSYISPRSTIFLAGDSAHQNIPTGGYGMNMGLGDSFDLGWKLATVINGHGGDFLLQSYEEDRRHIALNTIERSGVHIAVHINGAALLTLPYAELSSDAGIAAKKKVHQHYQENDGENKDLGIEMGFRYASSICIPDYSEEPEWKPAAYIPSTFPGSRAPHVFLSDGTPIFDHLGQYYTLVDFSEGSEIKNTALLLLNSAKEQNVPLKHLQLPDEHHARTIWEAVPFLVIRPDAHVAWRGSEVKDVAAAKQIIELISGFAGRSNNKLRNHGEDVPLKFSSVKDVTVQETTYVLDKMGLFQA